MDISARSLLTAGASIATATAIVLAPSVAPPTVTPPLPPGRATVTLPTQLAADVTPITSDALAAVVNLINNVAPNLDVPAAPAPTAAPAPLNATSNLIDSVYSFTRYWANYVSLDLTPWVLQFIPFGWLATDQINIWYSPFVLRTTDAFVYDFLDPIVNKPLNLGVWINSTIALANAAASGFINGVIGEINYLFGWILPPLPPLPNIAATAVTTQTLAASADAGTVPALVKAVLAPLEKTVKTAVADMVDAAEVTAPEPDLTAPEPEVTAPVAEVTAPEPEVTAPVAEVTAPEPAGNIADGAVVQTADQTAGNAAVAPTPAANAGTVGASIDPAPATDTTDNSDGAAKDTKADKGTKAATDTKADTDTKAATDTKADKPGKPEKSAKAGKSDKSDSGKPAKRTKDTTTAGDTSAKARGHDNQKNRTNGTTGTHKTHGSED